MRVGRTVVAAMLAAMLAIGVGGTAWADGTDAAGGTERGTITTEATARARLPNTVADVVIGVEAHGPSVSATQAALTAGSAPLMAYLQEQGVERLRTQHLLLQPHTATQPGQAERIVGYDGSVQASFRVPAERLGAVVAGALAHGGNDLAGMELRPREAEWDAERVRLAAEAAQTALAQADAVARATGRGLGAIRRMVVDPERGGGPVRPVMRAAAMAASAPLPTEAGDAEVTASVSVTAELIEPPR